MSRFFSAGYSDSESSSSEEDLLSSSEDELLSSGDESNQKVKSKTNEGEDDDDEDSEFATDSEFDDDSDSDSDGGAIGPSYFLKKSAGKRHQDSDSESEDEGKKIVKSAKDKLLDEMRALIENISSAKRTNNWVNILTDFDKLGRCLIRLGQQSITVPNFFIKALAQLDDFIVETNATEKQAKKKMNASISRAFNTTKQRVKKQVKEYQTKVDSYRDDPEAFESEEANANDATSSTAPSSSNQATATLQDDSGFATIGKAGKVIATVENVFTVLRSIAESRGKKNVDKSEQISTLESLTKLSTKPFELICVYLMLLSIRFDASVNLSFMPVDQWKAAEKDISSLLDVLEKHSSTYKVTEGAESTDDIEIEPTPNAEGVKEISGSVASLVERLDDELTKSLQVSDPHSTEYVDRLKDEGKLYNLIVRTQIYTETLNEKPLANEQLARVVLRRLDHIYYKPIQLIIISEKQAWSGIKTESIVSQRYNESVSQETFSNNLLDSLCKILYGQTNSIYRKKAMLCHIYYYAFNNQYFKSRDMFLMSHLQSTIHTSDAQLQVLFNRALAQMGLCAFRSGFISESHQALQEIATSQKSKELLGQGFQRYNQPISSIEKQRLLPFHMHINLELLESVFLTCSLLLEIPSLAANSNKLENKKKNSTKSFKRALDFYERQYFSGPPENIRDHIMSAAKSLQKGNWKKSFELISSMKTWKLFPDTDSLLAMLKSKLQIEGLRTYIFTYKNIYSKLSVKNLSEIFELSENEVNAIISKMIFSEDISASINDSNTLILFNQSKELNKLQELSFVLSDKIIQLAEKNERLAFGGHQQQLQQNNSTGSNNSNSNQNKNYKYNNNNNNNNNNSNSEQKNQKIRA